MQMNDGRSKECAIVEFATAKGAAEAVLTLNDTELSGQRMFDREDRKSAGSGITGRDHPSQGGRFNRNCNQTSSMMSSDPESQSLRV